MRKPTNVSKNQCIAGTSVSTSNSPRNSLLIKSNKQNTILGERAKKSIDTDQIVLAFPFFSFWNLSGIWLFNRVIIIYSRFKRV
jgi:hypothetical protein